MIFGNGKNIPLNRTAGDFPNVSDAMTGWFQAMIFGVVSKVTRGFQVVEEMVEVKFQGVWQPFTDRQLMLKPEGQRAWSWFWCHADPSLNLEVDNVVIYDNVQYRVKAKKDYKLNGYVEYQLIEDFEGAGPTPVEETP